jgi:hypothetical protein
LQKFRYRTNLWLQISLIQLKLICSLFNVSVFFKLHLLLKATLETGLLCGDGSLYWLDAFHYFR